MYATIAGPVTAFDMWSGKPLVDGGSTDVLLEGGGSSPHTSLYTTGIFSIPSVAPRDSGFYKLTPATALD